MNESKILITGGAGYVGYSVARHLARTYPGAHIIVFDNFSKAKLENFGALSTHYTNITVIPWEQADIRDELHVREAFEQYRPETVIHLASIVDAFTTNRPGKDRECMEVNHEAAVVVARQAKEHGTRRFFFQSSVSVYSRGEELTEDSPTESLSTYGVAKLLAEKDILRLHDDRFKVSALRSATIVGYNPSFRYETIINLMCIRALYGITTNVFESALTGKKSYLTLDDEVQAIMFLLEHIDDLGGKVFNIKSFDTDLASVISLIEKEILSFPHKIVPQKAISQQVYTINCDQIKSLGFKPRGNAEDTIATTLKALKAQRTMNKELFSSLIS